MGVQRPPRLHRNRPRSYTVSNLFYSCSSTPGQDIFVSLYQFFSRIPAHERRCPLIEHDSQLSPTTGSFRNLFSCDVPVYEYIIYSMEYYIHMLAAVHRCSTTCKCYADVHILARSLRKRGGHVSELKNVLKKKQECHLDNRLKNREIPHELNMTWSEITKNINYF